MGKGAETRRDILDHALRLASESGLEGLSIGALAERAGMSKSGLFAHFSSRDNLQVAVLEETTRRFVERVVTPALQTARGEPRLRALFERWLDWGQADFMPGGCILLAAISELDERPGPARDFLVASERDWLDTLAQAARVAQREGHFRADLDPEQLAFDVFGVAFAYMAFARLFRAQDARERARAAFDRIVRAAQP